MPEQWFLRIEGKEYGPADADTLHDWKEDGRVLPQNEARSAESENWIRAAEIPGLFAHDDDASPPPLPGEPLVLPPMPGFFRICFDTVALYIRGFFGYLGLTLLMVVPLVLSELTVAMLDGTAGVDTSAKMIIGGAFSLCMMLLRLLALPVYITGIQLLTADLAGGRSTPFFELLNRSLKFWPRVALLCVVVYFAFGFAMIVPVVISLLILIGGPSFVSALLILLVGVLQVWLFGKLFVNFLFWQQCAVLEENDLNGTLRRSKRFAHARGDLPWYKRPLWQGVFVSSLWMLFVLLLSLPTVVPVFEQYWKLALSTPDPQKLMEAMAAVPRGQGIERLNFALGILEAMLRPLLGIPFVLIYLAARSSEE